MLPGENINEYYVRFHKLVNDMRNIRMTMPNIQLNSKFVNNMSPEWDRFVTAVKLNKADSHAQRECVVLMKRNYSFCCNKATSLMQMWIINCVKDLALMWITSPGKMNVDAFDSEC
ncbi:hypothetical protein Tco_1082056 [Tanacetum coccineum]|uniref:Uncharacterized protein n=1 Tax=Tanacetum coccineum TaxID=301880 RepID=A0ABQ5HZ91_9ASTR